MTPLPNPGQRVKINLIFILLQLSEMYGAGRVNNGVNQIVDYSNKTTS